MLNAATAFPIESPRDLGADDYMTKPFACLSRSHGAAR